MAYTTFAQVEKIIEIDSNITTDAAEFIETANHLVVRLGLPTATDSSGAVYHDATSLELVERWLTAHFYAVRDPRVVREAAGSVSAQYESKVDLYLENTRYGQQALLVDHSGKLSDWNTEMKDDKKRSSGGVNWLGKPYEDQNL